MPTLCAREPRVPLMVVFQTTKLRRGVRTFRATRSTADSRQIITILTTSSVFRRGERGHCRMVRVPTLAEEDAKRPNRERECLVKERTRLVNRMKGTLARLGIRNFRPTLRKAAEHLAALYAGGLAAAAECLSRTGARHRAARRGDRPDQANRGGSSTAIRRGARARAS
jgi:transposase